MKSIPDANWPDLFFTDIDRLLDFVELDISKAPYKLNKTPTFPFRVDHNYAQRINKGDWLDPLLLQVIPRIDELVEQKGFTVDPVGEEMAMAAPGVLQKYPFRALLLISSCCAIHCRYCFRSKFTQFQDLNEASWDYLEKKTDIKEVILSGGDPLCISNDGLQRVFSKLMEIDHIRVVRIHTRIPVANPMRIDNVLLDSLRALDRHKRLIVVIHTNHAQELQGECSEMLFKMRSYNLILLNQGVLLKGINDTAEKMGQLSAALIEHGVLPYYIHQLDPVAGAGHFEVHQSNGEAIIDSLRECSAGYAVPRYVREIPGQKSKKPLR